MKGSDEALGQHHIGYFLKAGDIGAHNQVARYATLNGGIVCIIDVYKRQVCA